MPYPSCHEELEDFFGISPVKFEYLEPTSIKEACSLLEQYKDKAKVIAGGTYLIPLIKEGKITPEYLINLKNIPNLDYIADYSDFGEEGVRIGALATLFDISRSLTVNEKAHVFVESIGKRELKINKRRWAFYMTTIGGCLFIPEAATDIVPALMILGTKAVMQDIQGWEAIPVKNLYNQNEEKYRILTEIRIPKSMTGEEGLVYEKSTGEEGKPGIGAAVRIKLDPKRVNVENLRIVVGGTGYVAIEAKEGAELMKGNPIDNYLIMDTADKAAEEACNQCDDETKERTRDLIEEAIRHAIDRAIGDFALGY